MTTTESTASALGPSGSGKPRLMIVATVPVSIATFLAGQPRFLAEHFDVSLVCSDGPELAAVAGREQVPVHTIPMSRRITPRSDLAALRRLVGLMRRQRPDIVHSYTPKAGLLAMLAARAAGVPIRLHTVVGMPLVEAEGLRRLTLAATERLTYSCASQVYSITPGLIQDIPRTWPRRDPVVVGTGSINGVDCRRFDPAAIPAEQRAALRTELGIAADEVVVTFIGRLVGDKGITELIGAFGAACAGRRVRLLLVGREEPELDPLPESVRTVIAEHPQIRTVGWVSDTRPYLSISDLLVLPTYREGLPTVLMEAGAMGVAALATTIPGCRDIVRDGRTGVLVPPKDTDALRDALIRLLDDPALRATLARGAREVVLAAYEQSQVQTRMLAAYRDALAVRDRGTADCAAHRS